MTMRYSTYDRWKLGLNEEDRPDCLTCGDLGCDECEPQPAAPTRQPAPGTEPPMRRCTGRPPMLAADRTAQTEEKR